MNQFTISEHGSCQIRNYLNWKSFTEQPKMVLSQIGKWKVIQTIGEIVDFFHPNPNQTQPFHRHQFWQTVEPIHIFQRLKKQMEVLHFGRTKSHPFSKEHFTSTLISCTAIVSSCVFLVSLANGIEEILESVYMTIAMIGINIPFMKMICVAPKLFKFMDKIEEFINGSELLSF